jgi:3D (Asp-Asp-Asp) domain-containing protein
MSFGVNAVINLIIAILFAASLFPAPVTHRITCYSRGYRTADGTVIDWQGVEDGTVRIAAVSQHLRDEYPYGTIIWVEAFGPYVVRDCTAHYIKDTVDLAWRGPGFREWRRVWVVLRANE